MRSALSIRPAVPSGRVRVHRRHDRRRHVRHRRRETPAAGVPGASAAVAHAGSSAGSPADDTAAPARVRLRLRMFVHLRARLRTVGLRRGLRTIRLRLRVLVHLRVCLRMISVVVADGSPVEVLVVGRWPALLIAGRVFTGMLRLKDAGSVRARFSGRPWFTFANWARSWLARISFWCCAASGAVCCSRAQRSSSPLGRIWTPPRPPLKLTRLSLRTSILRS